MAFGAVRGTLEQASTNPATGISATGSIACSVGDLIFVLYAFRTAVTPTVSDSQGDGNYSALNAGTAANGRAYSFYKRVTSAFTLTSVTSAHASDTADAALMVVVYEGPFDASPLDINGTANADNTSPFSCPATGTLAQADELVIGVRAMGNGATEGSWGANNSFVVDVDETTGTGANTCCGAVCSKVVAATTTQTPEFTNATATNGNNNTFSFKKGVLALTPSLFDDGTDTFFAPTVGRGAVGLTPSLFNEGTDTFYSASVARGAVTLAASLYSDADTFFSHTLVQSDNLAPSLYSDADTFFAAAVTVSLVPSLYVDADTFFSPEVFTPFPQTLDAGLFTSEALFFSPLLFISYGNVAYVDEEDRSVLAAAEDRTVMAVEA